MLLPLRDALRESDTGFWKAARATRTPSLLFQLRSFFYSAFKRDEGKRVASQGKPAVALTTMSEEKIRKGDAVIVSGDQEPRTNRLSRGKSARISLLAGG